MRDWRPWVLAGLVVMFVLIDLAQIRTNIELRRQLAAAVWNREDDRIRAEWKLQTCEREVRLTEEIARQAAGIR
jgi:hypothetical protein